MENDKPIKILNYIKRIIFSPNVYITYKIMLTILMSIVSVSAEKSFSNIKIIKMYYLF